MRLFTFTPLTLVLLLVLSGAESARADGTLTCHSIGTKLEIVTDFISGAPTDGFFKSGDVETRIAAIEEIEMNVVVEGRPASASPIKVWQPRKEAIASAFARPDLKVFTFEISDPTISIRVVAVPSSVTLKPTMDEVYSTYIFDADATLYPGVEDRIRMKCIYVYEE